MVTPTGAPPKLNFEELSDFINSAIDAVNGQIDTINSLASDMSSLRSSTAIGDYAGAVKPYHFDARDPFTTLMNPKDYKETPVWAGASEAQNSIRVGQSYNTVEGFMSADIGERILRVSVGGAEFARDAIDGSIIQDNGERWAIFGPAFFENRAQAAGFALAIRANGGNARLNDRICWGGLTLDFDGAESTISDMQGWKPAIPYAFEQWKENTNPGVTDMTSAVQDAITWVNTQTENGLGLHRTGLSGLWETVAISGNVSAAACENIAVTDATFSAIGAWTAWDGVTVDAQGLPLFGEAMFDVVNLAVNFQFENCGFLGNHICPGFVRFDDTRHRCGVISCRGHGPTEFGFLANMGTNSDLDIAHNRIAQFTFNEPGFDSALARTSVLIDVRSTDHRVHGNTAFYAKIPLRISTAGTIECTENHPFNGACDSPPFDKTITAVFRGSTGRIVNNYLDNGVTEIQVDTLDGALVYLGNRHVVNSNTSTTSDVFIDIITDKIDTSVKGLAFIGNVFSARNTGDVTSEVKFSTVGGGSFANTDVTSMGNSYLTSGGAVGAARGIPAIAMPDTFSIDENGHAFTLEPSSQDFAQIRSTRGLRIESDHDNNSGAIQSYIEFSNKGTVYTRQTDDGFLVYGLGSGDGGNNVMQLSWNASGDAIFTPNSSFSSQLKYLVGPGRWEFETDLNLNAGTLLIDGTQVVGNQHPAISDVPTAGSATVADNATAINSILSVMRSHGLIET